MEPTVKSGSDLVQIVQFAADFVQKTRDMATESAPQVVLLVSLAVALGALLGWWASGRRRGRIQRELDMAQHELDNLKGEIERIGAIVKDQARVLKLVESSPFPLIVVDQGVPIPLGLRAGRYLRSTSIRALILSASESELGSTEPRALRDNPKSARAVLAGIGAAAEDGSRVVALAEIKNAAPMLSTAQASSLKLFARLRAATGAREISWDPEKDRVCLIEPGIRDQTAEIASLFREGDQVIQWLHSARRRSVARAVFQRADRDRWVLASARPNIRSGRLRVLLVDATARVIAARLRKALQSSQQQLAARSLGQPSFDELAVFLHEIKNALMVFKAMVHGQGHRADEAISALFDTLAWLEHRNGVDHGRQVVVRTAREALDRAAAHARTLHKLTVELRAPEDLPHVGTDAANLLRRVLQEILTNVAKHATPPPAFPKMAEIDVTLLDDNRVSIKVEDNGAAFDGDLRHRSGLMRLQRLLRNGNIIMSQPAVGRRPGSCLVEIMIEAGEIAQ